MTIRDIVTVPHPALKKVAAPIEVVTDDTRALFDDMLETMYHADGIGLAAPQIGISKRLIVMAIPNDEGALQEYYLANPEIVSVSESEHVYKEGCLSVPEQYEEVVRPEQATISFLNYEGEPATLECDSLLATCVQHEIDHLNGIVFIDHLTKLKRDMILRKIKKMQKSQ